MKIGFIGLGHMGTPMVKNLLQHQHDVTVYDLNPEAVTALVTQGAVAATTVQDVAVEADMVITMLQNHDQVGSCCLGEQGVFSVLASNGGLFVDCSTVDVEASRQLNRQAQLASVTMLDAPVSGGVAAAESATLTFMVGGVVEAFERAQAILLQMGKAAIHVGDNGSGAAAKICNNLILASSMIAVSESFVLAESLGLTVEKLFEVCSQSSAQCWSLTQYCPAPGVLPQVPSSHEYRAGFTSQMMLKDLKLGQSSASSVDVQLPLAEQARLLYQQLVDQGGAARDFSSIIQLLKGETVAGGASTLESKLCSPGLSPDSDHRHNDKAGNDKVE